MAGMKPRRYKLRVESDLLGMTHKCVVEAADLETFKSKLCRTIGIIYGQVQEDLVFSVWLPDFEDFALITDLSMLGDKSRVRVSSRAGGGAAANASDGADNHVDDSSSPCRREGTSVALGDVPR